MVGIIPTRVGTSSLCPVAEGVIEDHPHACGDKQKLSRRVIAMAGSSPRVWGQDSVRVRSAPDFGIIPTRVGTRAVNNAVDSVTKDHPHACGDKSNSAFRMMKCYTKTGHKGVEKQKGEVYNKRSRQI